MYFSGEEFSLVFLTSVFLLVQSTIFPNPVRPRLEVYSSISVPNGNVGVVLQFKNG